MLSKRHYDMLKTRIDAFHEWLESTGKNHYKPEEVPGHITLVTNEERSAVEVYEFMTTPPKEYTLYINTDEEIATTWTGEKLGDVEFGQYQDVEVEHEYMGHDGKTWSEDVIESAQRIVVKAINGKTYKGLYYVDSGDYANIEEVDGTQDVNDNEAFLEWLHATATVGDLLANGDILMIAYEDYNNDWIDACEEPLQNWLDGNDE